MGFPFPPHRTTPRGRARASGCSGLQGMKEALVRLPGARSPCCKHKVDLKPPGMRDFMTVFEYLLPVTWASSNSLWFFYDGGENSGEVQFRYKAQKVAFNVASSLGADASFWGLIIFGAPLCLGGSLQKHPQGSDAWQWFGFSAPAHLGYGATCQWTWVQENNVFPFKHQNHAISIISVPSDWISISF